MQSGTIRVLTGSLKSEIIVGMKINFANSFQNEWDQRIVYAPNGFGKTQSAKRLEQTLLNNGDHPGLFTRLSIENLISFKGGQINMGTTAEYRKQKDELEALTSKNDGLKQFLKNTYKATNAKAAKEKCFTMKRRGISSVSAIDLRASDSPDELLGENEVCEIESFLDMDLWRECLESCSAPCPKNQGAFPRGKQTDILLMPSAAAAHEELMGFIRVFGLRSCPVCGRRFRSASRLQAAVNDNLKRVKTLEIQAEDSKLKELAYRIMVDVTRSSSAIVKKYFSDHYLDTIKLARQIVATYAQLGIRTDKTTIEKLRNIKLPTASEDSGSPKTYGEAYDKIESLQKKISETEGSARRISSYNASLIREANKLIHWGDGISIRPASGRCGIDLLFEGAPVKNIYSFLSESEIKRLSLAALSVELRYGGYDSLILDDPVDSYDDYNKYSVCSYLCAMIKKLSLSHWYILTNDFETVINITGILRCDATLYLDNANDIFTSGPIGIFRAEATYQQIRNTLAKNELFFLSKLVSKAESSLDGRSSLIALSLVTTTRNFSNEFLQHLSGITTVGGFPKGDWSALVKERFVECAEHYKSPLLASTSASINSENMTVGQFTEPLRALNSTRSPSKYAWAHLSDSTLFHQYRKTEVQAPFPIAGTYQDIVNTIYKKMAAVGWIKYEFERKLIKSLEPICNASEMKSLFNAKGLKAKIEKAKTINMSHGNPLGPRLAGFSKIHDQNAPIYNAFDHCTFGMVFPYLSVSIADIRRFWESVRAL